MRGSCCTARTGGWTHRALRTTSWGRIFRRMGGSSCLEGYVRHGAGLRCRAQVEGSGGGSLFVTRAPPGGGRKVGTGGGWGRGCGRGVRVGRRLLLWWRVRRMDVLGGGTMVVVSSLSLCLFITPDPVSLSPAHLPPLPPLLSLLPLLFLRSLLPRTPRTCPLSSFLVTLVGFPQRWTREGT